MGSPWAIGIKTEQWPMVLPPTEAMALFAFIM